MPSICLIFLRLKHSHIQMALKWGSEFNSLFSKYPGHTGPQRKKILKKYNGCGEILLET